MDVDLREALSTPSGKRRHTRWVFSTIAGRYDLANVLLSLNRDRAWKRGMVARARVQPCEAALDLACGTGDISLLLAQHGARVVGLDITPEMITLARRKALAHQGPGTRDEGPVRFLLGDMLALPFPARTFDLVTTGYGIRNVPDLPASLREVWRVLRPGGRFFSLDFDRPPNPVVRAAYLAYLWTVGSAIGWAMYRRPDTYRYISETIRTYPGAPAVVSLLRSAGFEYASYEPVFGGLMALHQGVKGGS
jgi:demethylmenaquinone methyltransferase/2-methoxy-6-polyprenyl-1,4-benzoquinol methylase